MKLNNLDLNLVVEELKKLYNGKSNSDPFKRSEIKYLIISNLEANKNISLHSRELIVDSIISKITQEEITVENFKKSFKEVTKGYFKRPNKSFTVLTSLSIDYLPLRKVKINDSEIRIVGKKFPEKFKNSREKLYDHHFHRKEENNFLKLIVTVKDKHSLDAFDQANYDLNVFRGILCLIMNSSKELAFQVNNTRPINKVKFGYFHSLHLTESGDTANKITYWTDKDFPKYPTIFNKQKKDSLQKNIKNWIKKFNSCAPKHREKLSEVLNLYVEAFDEPDKHNCFIKGWTALESLLGTFENDLIIKRCSSIYKIGDRPYQIEILKSLRNRRNLLVHENDTKMNAVVNCYHIQQFIRGLLRYNNLKYYDIIKNNEEAVNMLDARLTDSKKIKSQMKVLQEISKIKKYES